MRYWMAEDGPGEDRTGVDGRGRRRGKGYNSIIRADNQKQMKMGMCNPLVTRVNSEARGNQGACVEWVGIR